MRRRVLFVTSEAYPVIKTGGLADYASGLTKALLRHDLEVRVLMPAYPGTVARLKKPLQRIELDDDFGVGPVSLVGGKMPDSGVPVWLVDCPALYARDGGIYLDADGEEWPDNDRRFGLLCRVAAALAMGRGPTSWRPHLVHLNDWQTGPVAAMLAQEPQGAPPTLFTIHNLAFQGLFSPDILPFLGLPPSLFGVDGVEFYGKVSFLKAGLRYATRIATVSEAYADEIMTPEFGCGLDGLLRHRAADLKGILNGADYDEWNPRTDAHLAANYDLEDLTEKAKCKLALIDRMALRPDRVHERPLLAYISRLTHQKMADLLEAAIPRLVERGAQVVVLGRGDHAIEQALLGLQQRHPGDVAVHIGYEERLAHQLLAGADMLMAPARFEPCGLTQMYALRYGTVPIVSHVGGLIETVVDAQPLTLADRSATGFVFEDRSLDGLLGAAGRALEAYERPPVWCRLQRAGMNVAFSWDTAAQRYEALYDQIAPMPASRRPATGKTLGAAAAPSAARKGDRLASLQEPLAPPSRLSH